MPLPPPPLHGTFKMREMSYFAIKVFTVFWGSMPKTPPPPPPPPLGSRTFGACTSISSRSLLSQNPGSSRSRLLVPSQCKSTFFVESARSVYCISDGREEEIRSTTVWVNETTNKTTLKHCAYVEAELMLK